MRNDREKSRRKQIERGEDGLERRGGRERRNGEGGGGGGIRRWW